LAAGLRLEPLGELVRSIRNEGHTSKRRGKRKGGEGPTYKGMEGMGGAYLQGERGKGGGLLLRGTEGREGGVVDENGGEVNSPQIRGE